MTRAILTVALLTVPVVGVVSAYAPLASNLAFGASADRSAHHSFAAHYFEDQSTSIEGEVAEFAYRSPHAFVYVMVKDASGSATRVPAEWASPDRLVRAGITRDTLKVGDYVIITGSPGRNPAERAIHLKAIERPADGWSWRPAPRTRP